jgi:hypothetical protein
MIIGRDAIGDGDLLSASSSCLWDRTNRPRAYWIGGQQIHVLNYIDSNFARKALIFPPPVTRMLLATKQIPQQVGRRQTILNLREETMKMRLLGALVGLAISFALPTFAQQTNTPDPQMRSDL